MSHPHITYYMNQLQKRNLKKLALLFSASLSLALLASVPVALNCARAAEETLSGELAPQILRFHVLANSNSEEDQNLKLEVKQLLIDTMYEDLENEELSKEELISYINEHKTELKNTAESYMFSKGFNYSADIRIEQCYFPTKIYGDVTFPCGTYDAVRVLLGNGSGKNWWCVLYPPLCFSQASVCEVPDSSKEELKNLLTENDYRDLMKHRRVVFGETKPSRTNFTDMKRSGTNLSNTELFGTAPSDTDASSPKPSDKNSVSISGQKAQTDAGQKAQTEAGKKKQTETSSEPEVTVRVRFRLVELLSRN